MEIVKMKKEVLVETSARHIHLSREAVDVLFGEGYQLTNKKELSQETIEDTIITDQIHQDVKHLVTVLPESQKEVLLMRYYRNMSFKEIADATGVSINTALGRMRYAILNMRRIAQEKDIVLTL